MSEERLQCRKIFLLHCARAELLKLFHSELRLPGLKKRLDFPVVRHQLTMPKVPDLVPKRQADVGMHKPASDNPRSNLEVTSAGVARTVFSLGANFCPNFCPLDGRG